MGFSGGDPENPFIYESGDFLGRVIRIAINWDPITRGVTGGTAYRDPGCLFTRIVVGVGNDGLPDSSPKSFTVPEGTTPIPRNVFNSTQIDTIEDVTGYQITAGTPRAARP